MERNLIQEKSYKFALRIIGLYKYLSSRKEFVLLKQVLRSGTSVGANIEEGIGCFTRKDFINKFNIAHKEARETHYWIRLLRDSDYLDKKLADSLLNDCNEILRISGKILSTSRKNI